VPADPKIGRAVSAAARSGDPGRLLVAIAAVVDVTPSGCWLYRGSIRDDGYPRVKLAGRHVRVHRLVAAAVHGSPMTGNAPAHHACGVARCVSPSHLRWATNAQNAAEMLGRHTYLARIAELEAALVELAPAHRLLRGTFGVGQPAGARRTGVLLPAAA
jgi:hypothetical protein